ncbi:DEAD/DEAH box helicase family protein [Planktothrix mougeotii]|uniref:DEAD/DEAH box helicase family protein n=1 Tax=Planktothrix mougeotii LEGE 06226 TaxID=1828728 RepID=A0ABR9UEL8_9CYAN|nr:DEAD/DEAH box helicase family protein [Planktothrix mougeotii]MBE9144906.1 DEAD/DEAH box helicase family protein [Planktothrix mougeotii LEGE 06226]
MNQLTLFDLLTGGQSQDSFTKNLLNPPKPFELRDYQKALKSLIYQLIRQGKKRILVYAPTGAGKTAILSSILSDALSRNKRCMLIVHRDFLVEQSRTAMIKAGINPDDIGIIKAGYREERDRMIQIAGLQSLQNRATPNDLDLIILDECHSTAFYKHYELIKSHTLNAVHLGFSASPWRLKSTDEYFGLHFDAIAEGPGIGELIDRGYLARPRYFGYGGLVDICKLDTNKSGEFKEQQMQAAFMASEVPQKVVEQILELGEGRTGIIFNAGVEQSQLQTQLLNAAGIPTVHLDASTPFKDRQMYFDKLASGEIRVISSIGCLTEGFDVPSISFIVLARATKSRALYVQMAGRGLRTSPNKTDCLILDFGGNVKRLGMLNKKFLITLEPTPKPEDDSMLKECDNCHSMVSIFAKICPECGFEFPGGSKPEDDTEAFEQQFGELFDETTLKQVKYARSQRKTRFSKSQPPDKLWETFSDKHNSDGKTFLCNDWLFGAVFGGKDNDYNRQLFLEYLEPFAPLNERTKAQWIKHHLELEFGKPGKQYRTGKNKTTEAKIGRNTKLDWWEILQCSPDSTLEEIKDNYRELAKKYHPDSSGFDSTIEMQILNLAFDKAKSVKGD